MQVQERLLHLETIVETMKERRAHTPPPQSPSPPSSPLFASDDAQPLPIPTSPTNPSSITLHHADSTSLPVSMDVAPSTPRVPETQIKSPAIPQALVPPVTPLASQPHIKSPAPTQAVTVQLSAVSTPSRPPPTAPPPTSEAAAATANSGILPVARKRDRAEYENDSNWTRDRSADPRPRLPSPLRSMAPYKLVRRDPPHERTLDRRPSLHNVLPGPAKAAPPDVRHSLPVRQSSPARSVHPSGLEPMCVDGEGASEADVDELDEEDAKKEDVDMDGEAELEEGEIPPERDFGNLPVPTK